MISKWQDSKVTALNFLTLLFLWRSSACGETGIYEPIHYEPIHGNCDRCCYLLPRCCLPVTETEETKCWCKEGKEQNEQSGWPGGEEDHTEVAPKPALKDEAKKEKAFQAEGVTGKEGRGAHRDWKPCARGVAEAGRAQGKRGTRGGMGVKLFWNSQTKGGSFKETTGGCW